jgi:hypothetical protein
VTNSNKIHKLFSEIRHADRKMWPLHYAVGERKHINGACE